MKWLAPNIPVRRRRLGGFTLIELLVVITIIAMLAAMLLPALSRARRTGKGAVCTSNLRQTSVAFALYSVDKSDSAMTPGAVKLQESLQQSWRI